VIKRIGLLIAGLWLAELAIGLLFQAAYSVIGAPTGAWTPVAYAFALAISGVPFVVAAWLIGRWEGLLGLQLTLTTAVAYVLGVAAGILVSAPVVTVVLTRTNPVIPGVDRAFSDYGVTALVGLFGAFVAVAVYWSVALISKRWFQPRTETAA
jgi:hypothetical protein